jgi:hypothetical protein
MGLSLKMRQPLFYSMFSQFLARWRQKPAWCYSSISPISRRAGNLCSHLSHPGHFVIPLLWVAAMLFAIRNFRPAKASHWNAFSAFSKQETLRLTVICGIIRCYDRATIARLAGYILVRLGCLSIMVNLVQG